MTAEVAATPEGIAQLPSGELCARLARALDAAMEDGDYVYDESVRWLVTEMVQDSELRLRARAGIAAAMERGDLVLVQSLTAALVESDGGWIVWRDKVRALLDPPTAELVS